MTIQIPPTVSDRAFERLSEISRQSGKTVALRVAVKGGGCSGFQYEFLFDEATEGDMVLEGNGQSVLIDSISLPFLENAVIDYSEELVGSRFTVKNPNAKSTCGCAMSFSL